MSSRVLLTSMVPATRSSRSRTREQENLQTNRYVHEASHALHESTSDYPHHMSIGPMFLEP
jgi:hypothetical protein